MVRKTHKGIVGNAPITNKKRPHIGPGINFKELGLGSGEEIAKAAKEADKQL